MSEDVRSRVLTVSCQAALYSDVTYQKFSGGVRTLECK
jgi:hypothetical protein